MKLGFFFLIFQLLCMNEANKFLGLGLSSEFHLYTMYKRNRPQSSTGGPSQHFMCLEISLHY